MSRILLVILFGLLLAAVSSAISTTAVKTTIPYYDLKVSTNKEVYYPRETAELTITIINRGPLPDKDLILTFFVDDYPVHREILQQVDIGTTIINKSFYVGNMSFGTHTSRVEYNITHQGDVLTVFSTFAVDSNQTLITAPNLVGTPDPPLIIVPNLIGTPYPPLIPVPNLVVTILSVIVILLVLAGVRKIRKHVE